jgi:hypothetical protein
MNTFETLELNNGESIKLTLNFARLLKIKNDNKEKYEKYNNVILNGTKDIFDMIDVIYIAYLCANIDKNVKSYDEFIELVPPSTTLLAEKVNVLTNSKKK